MTIHKHSIPLFFRTINFFLIIFIGLCFQSFASDQIVNITSEKQFYNLAPNTYCLIDSNKSFTIDQIISENCPLVFKKNKQNELHNPHSYYNYWYKIQIDNKFQIPKSMVLEFANSTISNIHVFVKRNTKLVEFRATGNSLPFNTRDINISHFCFQLEFAANERLTIFAQILPNGDALNTPVELYDSLSFTNKSNKEGLLNGIYYGLMFLTIIISFVILLSFTSISKKSNYIFLGILLFFTLWNATLDGLAFQYLWPSNPWISSFCIYSLPLLGIIFMSLFADDIKGKQFLSILMFYIKLILSLIILLFILYTLKFNMSLAYIHAISLLLGVCMLLLTFFSWYIHIKWEPNSAKYFISLFASILAWLIIISLKTFTDILPSDFYAYSFKLFLGFQAIILTMLVVSKMRINYSESFFEKLINLNTDLANKNEEIESKTKELSAFDKDISLITNQFKKLSIELKTKNEQLILGINYTKNIQQSLLPNISANAKLPKQIFTLYKPKNELSSDTYFIKQVQDFLFVAVIDCSGSGVPSAVLTTLVQNILSATIVDKNIFELDKILLLLQSHILDLFNSNNNFFAFDSVDVGIISINIKNNFLSYSGTKIPVWIINNEGVNEFKGDTNSLCDNKSKREYHFTMSTQELKQGDMVYLFTNGYTNQFNSKNEKFMKKNLKILLSEIHSHPINIQRSDLEKNFLLWKGNEEQTDDILIVGIKI